MIPIEVDGVEYQVPSNAADTNWQAEQVAFEQALATAVNSAVALEFALLTPNIGAGWTNAGGSDMNASSALSGNGVVYVRGRMQGGASGTVCTTLPSGQRPAAPMRFPIALTATANLGFALVGTDGTITVTNVTGGSVTNGIDLAFCFSVAANS